MESIQAAGNAISMWGKSTKDLGIQYNEAVQESKDTSVTFLGKKKDLISTAMKLICSQTLRT